MVETPSTSARSRAYAQCEQLYRPIFHREPKDVLAELVSGEHSRLGMAQSLHLSAAMPQIPPQYGTLIDHLTNSSWVRVLLQNLLRLVRRRVHKGTKPRITPAPLAWSVALRASRETTIQASIEYIVCLQTLLTSSIYLFLGLDETVSMSTSRTN
jgi:hypothetical protein